MTPADHLRMAERQLAFCEHPTAENHDVDTIALTMSAAAVHAQLALVGAVLFASQPTVYADAFGAVVDAVIVP